MWIKREILKNMTLKMAQDFTTHKFVNGSTQTDYSFFDMAKEVMPFGSTKSKKVKKLENTLLK